jgi:hypothetical protein
MRNGTTTERLATWSSILERFDRLVPNDGRVQHLRELIERTQNGGDEQLSEIESGIHKFAVEHSELLLTAVEQISAEIFAILDPEIERFRQAKACGSLSDEDKAAGKSYLAMLEDCGVLLEEMKNNLSNSEPT